MRIQHKANRVDSKAEKKALEAQWTVMKTTHEAAVALWETKCDTQSAAGVVKRDLPKRPTWPHKPKGGVMKPAASRREVEDSGSEGSEEVQE